MDQHFHTYTTCPACLGVPSWQYGLFFTQEDFCVDHRYRSFFYDVELCDPLYFDEYHDGQEVDELIEWEREVERLREARRLAGDPLWEFYLWREYDREIREVFAREGYDW